MNKTDRLLAIVLELQRNRMLRAEDLAATFETSKRTIYRDIQALCEAGVPIVGSTGLGYSLMEGYFLPPMSFTVEEAVALLIGTGLIEHKLDTGYGKHAQSSRSKIEAVLPDSVRKEATRVRTTMRLLASDKSSENSVREKEYVEALSRVILEKRKVSFKYTKVHSTAGGSRHSIRTVAPYGLVLVNGSWVLVGHCDLRQELRHFRLTRMEELSVLEDQFTFPSSFNLQEYAPMDDRHITVRIQADRGIAHKIKECNNFYLEEFSDITDGLHATFRVRHIEELLPWLLQWGADIVVLEPDSLRNRVREEAEKLLRRY
ncbi:YafY family transcriptional regulator [Paenibacillus sp. N3/727]|uniref:helix-turn-helix transcriptional regulator n=1 Tax=Paenibacillus sp. N3/727 TaxID=2925845 RepID=UPI001F533F20|nr:YafY family protein [Paenibacillus sp. N3/727]UNK20924.1 YafY family transcriptional regulator [Paenibacillus sp. N3/727]